MTSEWFRYETTPISFPIRNHSDIIFNTIISSNTIVKKSQSHYSKLDNITMLFEKKVKNAVRIFRHVTTTGKFDFSTSDAMKWAGLAAELAVTETYKADFALYQRHVEQKHGPPP